MLKLYEFLDAEPVLTAHEVPVTLGDLERILTRVPSLREHFRPYHIVDRAYQCGREPMTSSRSSRHNYLRCKIEQPSFVLVD